MVISCRFTNCLARAPVFRITFIAVALLWSIMSAVAGGAPSTAPRLSDGSKFPREYQAAVRAVGAKVEAAGMKPGEYYAEITRQGSKLHFWLIHESHDPDPSWRGDSCRKCRTIDYDLTTSSVGPIRGIR